MIRVQNIKKSLTEIKLERLLKANKEHVSIGHFEESGIHYSGFTFPELMKLHHKGYEGVPARPVLEHLFQNHLKILNHPDVMRAMKIYADSRMTERDLTRMLQAVGKAMANEEVEIFGSNALVRNHPNTIKNKGEDAPLVHTQELVEEVSYKDSITKVRRGVL